MVPIRQTVVELNAKNREDKIDRDDYGQGSTCESAMICKTLAVSSTQLILKDTRCHVRKIININLNEKYAIYEAL